MEEEKFVNELMRAQKLVKNEEYEDAMKLLNELKKIESEEDFNYNLTHKLYQLISNTESLLNQKVILEMIREKSNDNKSISIQELHKALSGRESLSLSKSTLKREIELLILRGSLEAKLDADKIKLGH
jgi:replicative DNA helicase